MVSRRTSIAQLAAAMMIFGSLGLLRRSLPVPSELIALVRGTVGCAFLLVYQRSRGQKPNWALIRQNLGLLILSGIVLGLGWIVLFEAYRFTTVATATLCYYTAPILVVLASVKLFGERLTKRKIICAAVSALGMVLASGAMESNLSTRDLTGIAIGLAAAVLYAATILLNQKLKAISGFDRAIFQLGTTAAVLLPYVLMTTDFSSFILSGSSVWLLLTAGIVHTGIAYGFYFTAMSGLNGQTIALMSYLDPIVALLISALVLRESIGTAGMIGAILVLGSTVISEIHLPSVSPIFLKSLRHPAK